MIDKNNDYDKLIGLLQQNIRFLREEECIGDGRLELLDLALSGLELTNYAILNGARELDWPGVDLFLYKPSGLYWIENDGTYNCIDGRTGKPFWLPQERNGNGISARPVLAYSLINSYVRDIRSYKDDFLRVNFGEYLQNDLCEKTPVTWIVDTIKDIAIPIDLIIPGMTYESSLEYIKGKFIKELVSRRYFEEHIKGVTRVRR